MLVLLTPFFIAYIKEEEVMTNPRKVKGGSTQREWNFKYHIPQEELERLVVLAPTSPKQETYLNDQTNDIIVWGGGVGSGKTMISLIKLLLSASQDPDYVASVARLSQKQMKSAGSLWSEGCKLFTPMGVRSNAMELSWSFPNGSEVKCHHLDNNQNDWQGTQCTEFLVDEAQQCSEDDVWYLTSRMRSRSSLKHQLRMTCNPLETSFLCNWLKEGGYLLESGLPNPEMDGVTTYMVQVGGEFRWYSTYTDVMNDLGRALADTALKFVFYAANVYDNGYIRKYLPEYITKLENLKQVEKERLLLGNWFASTGGSGWVKREWFKEVREGAIPANLPSIRCWDLASTKPHENNKNPDWTRGVKASYDRQTGNFYILDLKSLRDRPAMVHRLMLETASLDTTSTYIGIPLDAGQAGRVVADQKKSELASMGFKVVLSSARKSKMERAEMFLIALQEGKVFVKEGVFSDENYRELEAFDGKRNKGLKDDIMDAIVDCYNNLTTGKLIPTIRLQNVAATGGGRMKRLGGATLL